MALLAPLPAWGRVCLPAVAEDGQRLQRLVDNPVTWLPLLFRQHEVCRRAEPGELRVFVTGSSGVHGFPLPADQSTTGVLNARNTPGVRFFNLGHLFTYQIKDALVVRASLEYEPDLIVHMLVLSDFVHRAPIRFKGIETFLDGNRAAVAGFAAEQPAGLTDPLTRIREDQSTGWLPALDHWRQTGRFLRLAAEAHARKLAELPGFALPDPPHDDPAYDCETTVRQHRERFAGWQDWNILEYLAEVRTRTGTPVVLVDWPVARRPRGRCASVRFPKRDLREYRSWLGETAERLELPLLDYSELLPAEEFYDSIHPKSAGQRKIATQLAIDLAPHLEKLGDEPGTGPVSARRSRRTDASAGAGSARVRVRPGPPTRRPR